MLANTHYMLSKARKNQYAIPQPNVWDANSIKAILKASKEVESPVIIGLAQAHLQYIGIEEVYMLANYYGNKLNAEYALHLDHGSNYETIVKAIKLGFSSVMIDASTLPFDENVYLVKEVVKVAHACNVTVEAELGHVGSGDFSSEVSDNSQSVLTEPDEAEAFTKKTNVDSLAIAIGTVHGKYKGSPNIDIDRLKKISEKVSIPLVLHGGSGTGEDILKKCIKSGISKINICTDLMLSATKGVKEVLEATDNYGDINLVAEEAIKTVLINYYKAFNCINRI